MIDPADFKQGMRRLAAGVSVITTLDEGQPHGFVATSVTSVAADPTPTLLVCVNRSVSCHDVIDRSGSFCVNLLGEPEVELAKAFSSSALRHARFSTHEWRALTTGAPALVGALASFDCELAEKVSVHSHTIFLGRVVAIHLPEGPLHPLIYAGGQFDTLGSRARALQGCAP
ncbi:flavin reductase family protein [Starkeya koreensis]|uniref:Flavin reductase family protein n=1 Tax=Ancylobacter koreensis TaxID=266121 RepID=A0ABT0DHG7_9HYPH|nr:flavin reductase family protein [Ancylobacter koreensis]MCK0206736.1 flavin reductase family protein [Ancylobacter koreensis]